MFYFSFRLRLWNEFGIYKTLTDLLVSVNFIVYEEEENVSIMLCSWIGKGVKLRHYIHRMYKKFLPVRNSA